jgi:lambda family phage portal protein
MFDSIKRNVRKVFHRISASTAVLLRGQHYDNASTHVENERHWRNARDLPPITTNTPETRRILRERARYEEDNNSYCGGMVSTLATDTVGYVAPTPQVMTDDVELKKFLESEWKQWSESPVVNLPEKLHVLDRARRTDGESFLLFINDPFDTERETGYGLNVVVIPQSRVMEPNWNTWTNVETREVEFNGYTRKIRLINDDGVIINATTGQPYEYKVANIIDEVRGFQPGLIGSNLQTVSARYMKHWFKPKRPGQFRGVCEFAASLGLFAQLRRYGLATLGAAEIAAMMTVLLKTTLPADDNGQPAGLEPFSARDFERNMVTAMPDGWDVTQLKAEQPITAYDVFVKTILREIGRVLDIPYGIIAGDHSSYNYSSARLDVTGYDERMKFDRNQLAIKILNPLFYEFLLEISIRRPDVERALATNKLRYQWKYTNRPSIDPSKDADVDDIRLRNGSTTLSEVFAARGLDWQEQIEQRSKEKIIISEKGLDIPAQSDTINGNRTQANSQTDVQQNS